MSPPAPVAEAITEAGRLRRRLVAGFAAWPWWAQVLAVYAVARGWSALVLNMASRQQKATGWAPANPTYAQYTGLFWDAEWYHKIATTGYPVPLPVGENNVVSQNEWAFFPLFPFVNKVIISATGLSWEIVAPTVALLAGAAAMLVIYRLVSFSYRGGAPGARWVGLATVLLVSFFPSSPVLQIAYTESFALLAIASFLYLVVRRYYVAALPVVIAVGFTRAVALPLTVVVIVHAALRWRHRARDRVSPGQWAALALLAIVSFGSGFIWQVVTAVATGRSDAYFATQAAWRAGNKVTPIEPWLTIGRWLFGDIGGVLVFFGVLAAIVLVVMCRPAWRIGTELQAWVGAYLLYLVGVIEPGTSLARFLLLAFPIGTICVLVSRSRAYLATLAISFALFQIVWVVWLWQLNAPTGWPP